MQPDEESSEGRLSAAGLADDAECLTASDVERDTVDRVNELAAALEGRAADREMLDEIMRLEQRLCRDAGHALFCARRRAGRSAGSRWQASAWSADTRGSRSGRTSHASNR